MRVFCMTDDKEEKTLEHQEHFHEIAKSRDVEVSFSSSNSFSTLLQTAAVPISFMRSPSHVEVSLSSNNRFYRYFKQQLFRFLSRDRQVTGCRG
jgi:hypothetical protein